MAHVAKMFELAGIADPQAAAARVMAVETGLAKHHWDRVKSRDRTLTYNKLSRKQLDELAPGYDWAAWLAAYGVKPIEEVVVRQPDLFHGDGRNARLRFRSPTGRRGSSGRSCTRPLRS